MKKEPKAKILSAALSPAPSPAVSLGYRIFRALVRLWFALFFHKIRLLRAEVLPASGAAMLFISHPASFLDALILVSAFERQLHCLLDRKLVRGPLRGLFAWGLGMIPYEAAGKDWQSTRDACRVVLAKREAVAVFAEPRAAKVGDPPCPALTASTIALETEMQHSAQLGLTLFPVYLFLPVGRSPSSELLIYVEAPQYPHEYLARGDGDLPERARAFAKELESTCRRNAFRLEARELRRFLSDLEEVLRADLEEDWASRPNWKQKVEGFELSQFLTEWAEQLNWLNPGRLVGLRELLDRYRESRRRWSLARLEVETAGMWLKSPWHRAWVWVESVVGLPIAGFGLANHLLAGLLLVAAGLLESGQSQKVKWLMRGLVLLGCYAGQILACAYWLGRAAAGYYALSLPLAGAYLWRYRGWLRNRTRLLLVNLTLARRAARLHQFRKELLEDLNASRNAYAETLGVAH